jgi:hypothetical protein
MYYSYFIFNLISFDLGKCRVHNSEVIQEKIMVLHVPARLYPDQRYKSIGW